MSDDDLAPCPFCGGGETRVDEFKMWTGTRSLVQSVAVQHWCPPNPESGGTWRTHIKIQGKTRAQAVANWNRRSPPKPKG